jgi:hypothetical protein
MSNKREWRMIVGGLIWLGLLGFGLLVLRQTSAKAPGGFRQLARYVSHQNMVVPIEFSQPLPIAVGDLVFLSNSPIYAPVGVVSRVGTNDSTTRDIILTSTATVTLYGNAPPLGEDAYLTHHLPGNDTGWVIETMLPPEKRKEISKLLMEAYTRDSSEIVAAMRPIIANSLSTATGIVRADLQAALSRREDRLRLLSEKYREELIDRQLVPLFREEIWPIIKTEAEPLAMKIGQEVWREVSLFRFAWRYVYDRSVGPEEKLANKELVRFLETKVVPIVESHVGEILQVQQKIVAAVSSNQRVRETFLTAVRKISSDPEIQQVLGEIFQEVLISNQRLRDSLQATWKSPAALAAIEMTSARLEPTINEIGIALFGSTDQKITPEFARVLRHRILQKDSRWLTLHVAAQPHQYETSRPSTPTKLTAIPAYPPGQVPYAPARDR